MGIKEAWEGLIGKSPKAETEVAKNDEVRQIIDADLFPIVKIPQTALQKYERIPLSGLASLGTAFSFLPDSARAITQTTKVNTGFSETVYRAINPKGIIGTYSNSQFGLNGNIMQVNNQGKNVIAGRLQFQPVNSVATTNITSSMTMPLDPTLLVVAVAVMAIEQKLDKIQQSVENVIQFLELEKQATQRGNLKKLAEIADEYKSHCDDASFCDSRNVSIQSIQTDALRDIIFYQEKISAKLADKKLLHLSTDASSLMNNVIHEFAEYQLSCYLYAYCVFMDIMLRADFNQDNLDSSKAKITALADKYNELYLECYSQIKNYHLSSIDKKIADGVGSAITGLGKAVRAIPRISDGNLDEALIEAGKKLDDKNAESIEHKLKVFDSFADSKTESFIDSIKKINVMTNRENTLLTDGESLFVLNE